LYVFSLILARRHSAPDWTFPLAALRQEGSFAFGFKSAHFPGEIVMARRGSPLLIGVKTDKKLKVDFVDVEVATENDKVELSELF
jgi:glucosamine 6-phosphate synthetase-like amidotransferase/phosphosugar isomerase protein